MEAPSDADEPGDPSVLAVDETFLKDSSGPVWVLVAVYATWFKQEEAQSRDLTDGQRCAVASGERLLLASPAIDGSDGRHYRIQLFEGLPGCSFDEGFVYGDHFRIEDVDSGAPSPRAVATITASRTTWFKSSEAQASELGRDERCAVVAGEVLGLAEIPEQGTAMHFRVVLDEPREGCGFSEGFVYGPHFGLDPETMLRAEADTWLKAEPRQSSELAAADRCLVRGGALLVVLESPLFVGGGHYAASLSSPIPGCGFSDGFIYGPHFGLEPGIAIAAVRDTWLKEEIRDSTTLEASQLCRVGSGEMVELEAPPELERAGHYRVRLARPRPGCDLVVGYVYGEHFGLEEPVVVELPLNAPYFYQYFNRHEPGGTCGLTSAAMLLGFWARNLQPDDLYLFYGKRQGQSPTGLAQIYRNELGHGESTYGGSRAMIRRHLDEGRPVAIHGYFTGSGHIMLVVGYDAAGWIVHDPAGRWAGCHSCGYPSRTSTNGRFAHYSYSSMSNAVLGSDGGIWLSVGSTSPFAL